jgi:hypothetical protein
MRMTGVILLGFLLAFSASAQERAQHLQTAAIGTAAKAVVTTIDGSPVPAQWPLGVPLYLTARDSTFGTGENSLVWYINPAWNDRKSLRLSGGRALVLATGTRPQVVTIILVAAKGESADMLRITLALVPADGEPMPQGNDRTAKIADMVRTKVEPYPGRAAMAKGLADDYDMIAAAISKAVAINPPPDEMKPYTEPQSLVEATGVVVRKRLGDDVNRWRPFFSSLRDYLNDLGQQGKLGTAGDHIPVFRDIAAGLRMVD